MGAASKHGGMELKVFTVRMPVEVYRALTGEARRGRRSVNKQLTHILERHFAGEGVENADTDVHGGGGDARV